MKIPNFRQFGVFLLLILLLQAVLAQKSKPTSKLLEKQELEKALSSENLDERIESLKKFLEKFPDSKSKNAALEALASAYISLAEEKLKNGAIEESIQYFKTAVSELPTGVTDEFFTKNLLKIPDLLFFNSQQIASIEIARLIEEKIANNAKQLVALATFYLKIEDGESAKKLAEKAIQIDNKLLPAYQTLGLANRLNFDLEASVKAYEKALEIAPDSIVVKQNLADVKRGLGRIEEALKIYQQILQSEPESLPAKTGLVLSLLELGKINEVEAELEKAKDTGNFVLLTGVAYWYARKSLRAENSKANEYAEKAISIAQESIKIQPRYVWSYIALARGFLAQNNPSEAEKALLIARQYGNFPTLDYELAAVRLASGFYGEAAETLEKSFSVSQEGLIETRLGNRIVKFAKDFPELISLELRAGIFQQEPAGVEEEAQKLKSLLLLEQKLKEKPNEADVVGLIEEFVRGSDKTRAHRLIFAAKRLTEEKVALSKALDLIREVIGEIEMALEIPSASSFVLSDQLYESRRMVISRGQLIVVPQIPRQTLLKVMRGKVEEITGWIFYQQNKLTEAIVHLKRAVSILPEDSAWWRSSLWRLGACYEANGDLTKALDAYIRSYRSSEPDSLKRTVIENLYKKIYGNLDGLEDMLLAGNKSDFLTKQAEVPKKQAENLTDQPQEQIARKTDEVFPSETEKSEEETLSKPEININPEEAQSRQMEQNQSEQDQPKFDELENQLHKPKNQTSSKEVKSRQDEIEALKNELTEETIEEKVSENETEKIESQKTEAEPKSEAETSVDKSSKISGITLKSELSERIKNSETQNSLEIKPEETELTKSFIEKTIPSVSRDVLADKSEANVAKKIEARNESPQNIEVGEERVRKVAVVTDGYVAQKLKEMQIGQVRPRIVKIEALQQRQDCNLVVSQEEITILRNGGRLGILVGYKGADEALNKIIAIPDSPADIQVEYELEIAETSNQLFLIVQSVSEKTGVFNVLLKSPCGNREIRVRVK